MDPSLPSGAWRLGRGNRCWATRVPHPVAPTPHSRAAAGRSHLHAGPFLPPSAPPGPEPGPPSALSAPSAPSAPISPAGDRPRSPVPSQEAPPPGLSRPPIGPPAAPAAVCPGYPAAHWPFRILPGSLKKKKKSFMGGWKGPGQRRGREGPGGAAAGGREGRRRRRRRDSRSADPGPRAFSTFLPPALAAPGCRHDGECSPCRRGCSPSAPPGREESDSQSRSRAAPLWATPSSLPGGAKRSRPEEGRSRLHGPAVLPHLLPASPFRARSLGNPHPEKMGTLALRHHPLTFAGPIMDRFGVALSPSLLQLPLVKT